MPGLKINIQPLFDRAFEIRDEQFPDLERTPKRVTPEAASTSNESAEVLAKVDSNVQRIKEIISKAGNSAIELDSVEVVQEGQDLIIRGDGRNIGDCVLASLHVTGKVGPDTNGVLIFPKGRSAFEDIEIPIGGGFSFELYFDGTLTNQPVKLQFTLDDLSDLVTANNPTVPSKLTGGTLLSEITINQ